MTDIEPRRDAAADEVEARLRYRPAGDLLIGEVRLEVVDEMVDDLDTDTSVTWGRRAGSDSAMYLSSFSIIGAQRRFRDHRPDFLPESIWKVASSMFGSLPPSTTGSSARLEARAEARLIVSLRDVRRVDSSLRSTESDVSSARSLAASLRDLGASVRLALDAVDATDPALGTPARRFLDGIDSLASLVAAHRRSSPSSIADLVDNLRGGLPLSDTERRRLRHALDRAHDPDQWKVVAHELNQLAAAVRGERRIDSTEGT